MQCTYLKVAAKKERDEIKYRLSSINTPLVQIEANALWKRKFQQFTSLEVFHLLQHFQNRVFSF